MTFSDKAYFNGVTFSQGGDFSNTYFKRLGSFFCAAFELEAKFPDATFNRDASFSDADFKGDAEFLDATFGDNAEFFGATFSQDANFFRAKFDAMLDLRNAIFSGQVDFRGNGNSQAEPNESACFGTETLFSGVHFRKRADFFRRRFGPYGKPAKELTFANAVFDGPVSFEESEFPDLMPVLTNTTLPESTKVTADEPHWPALPPGPLARLDMRLGLRKRRTIPRQDPAVIKASAASLRHAMSRQILPEEEHFFFRREMWAAGRTGPWLRRLPVLFYGAVSDYGHSIGRPAFLLSLLWLIGVAVYAVQLGFSVIKALVYSFATMFKFFGLQGTYLENETDSLTEAMEFFAGSQTVLAFILLFFLGLGLRTRFRLR